MGDYHWNLDVSWFSMERKRVVTVIGEQGQAVWDEDTKSLHVYKHTVKDNRLVKDTEPCTSRHYDEDCLELELAHFVDCINTKQQPLTDLNQALGIAQYIDEAHRLLNISV
jgi:predicted dehydrogenase